MNGFTNLIYKNTHARTRAGTDSYRRGIGTVHVGSAGFAIVRGRLGAVLASVVADSAVFAS